MKILASSLNLFLLIVVASGMMLAATITTTGTGNWNSVTPDAPWPSGIVPGSTDDVVIASGHTVTLDVLNAACNHLTIDGKLRFAIDGTVTGITVNGNIIVNSGGLLRVETRSPAGAANSFVEHSLILKGNLTNGGGIDFRGGSNGAGTANGVLLTLDGSSNSTINLTSTTYQSSVEEFNGITINKTGGAKVILASGNLFMSNNSTVGACVLTFTSGMIETGTNLWVALSTSSAGVSGASTTMYVNGRFGRGMSTSGATTRQFEIGTSTGYRPISIHSTTGLASGGFVVASQIEGNANTGSSIISGGIDGVSALRYYQINAFVGTTMAAATISADIFSPSYLDNDGVNPGNIDLRVAYSTDNRTNWIGIAQTAPHLTTPAATPTTITPDALSPVLTLNGSTTTINVALASTNDGNPVPVELTSFIAYAFGSTVQLKWQTATEVNNYGFEIQRSKSSNNFEKIGFINGSGNSNSAKDYTFTDKNISAGKLKYRLKMIDADGGFQYSNTVEAEIEMPGEYAISQNYPNPFNPTTRIDYQLPFDSKVTLELYGITGEKVATIINSEFSAGYYTADVNASSFNLVSGIYIYKMTASNQAGQNFVQVKKLMLTK